MNNTKDICKEIGEKLKELRVQNGYSSYENFAIEHDLSRMQYWRIEKGLTNLTIRSLVKILNIHKVSVDDFFHEALDHKSDHAGGKRGSRSGKGARKTKRRR